MAIMMADGSDDPSDLVLYHGLLEEGYDCAFGSRFVPGAEVTDYPRLKLAINRVVNLGIRLLFRHRYNDTTNAFKAYRREVIEGDPAVALEPLQPDRRAPAQGVVRGLQLRRAADGLARAHRAAARSSTCGRWAAATCSSCSTCSSSTT